MTPEGVADAAAAGPAGRALRGKAQRVTGMFVLMIGAGLILDRHLVWAGAPLLGIGVGFFGWGWVVWRAAGGS